jgi:hypothetical protein
LPDVINKPFGAKGLKYRCVPYPGIIRSEIYRGYVKLRIIPNAIYNVILV